MDTTATPRVAEADADPRFRTRWSPRAFADAPVSEPELAALFEAARWAPSCFNEQPWYYLHSADEAGHAAIAGLLMEGNSWANKAPVLCVAFAKRSFTMNGKENGWRQHDVGMANMALALQAAELGLATHFMAGFDAGAAPAALGLDPEEYEAVCVIAIGRPGDAGQLPEELQAREQPSPRKPLAEVASPARPA